MKTLETLTKVAAKKVEEKQKEIADLQKVIDQMLARKAHLQSSIQAEYKVAETSGDANMFQMAGHYHQRAKAELVDIDEAMANAQKIMGEKRAQLQNLFAEQKRYEILLERRKAEAHKERLKKDQAVMDELGSQKEKTF